MRIDFVDRKGDKVGKWTVLELAPKQGRSTMWLCRCDCGVQKPVAAQSLASGDSVSCGCRKLIPSEEYTPKVLKLYHDGLTNRTIADQLGIHHSTVGNCLTENGLKAHYFGKPIDIVDDFSARCRKCLEIVPLTNF